MASSKKKPTDNLVALGEWLKAALMKKEEADEIIASLDFEGDSKKSPFLEHGRLGASPGDTVVWRNPHSRSSPGALPWGAGGAGGSGIATTTTLPWGAGGAGGKVSSSSSIEALEKALEEVGLGEGKMPAIPPQDLFPALRSNVILFDRKKGVLYVVQSFNYEVKHTIRGEEFFAIIDLTEASASLNPDGSLGSWHFEPTSMSFKTSLTPEKYNQEMLPLDQRLRPLINIKEEDLEAALAPLKARIREEQKKLKMKDIPEATTEDSGSW